MSEHQGLKNHQIAGLVSSVAKYLQGKWPELPRSVLQEEVRYAVFHYLRSKGLMLDSAVNRVPAQEGTAPAGTTAFATVLTTRTGGSHAGDGTGPAPPRETAMTEMALELADIMASMGLADSAAKTLVDHLCSDPDSSIPHWRKLLDVMQLANEANRAIDPSKALAGKLNLSFAREDGDPHALEAYPHLLQRLVSLWPDPPAAERFLVELLTNTRGGARQGFSRSVVDEILMLRGVIRAAA